MCVCPYPSKGMSAQELFRESFTCSFCSSQYKAYVWLHWKFISLQSWLLIGLECHRDFVRTKASQTCNTASLSMRHMRPLLVFGYIAFVDICLKWQKQGTIIANTMLSFIYTHNIMFLYCSSPTKITCLSVKPRMTCRRCPIPSCQRNLQVVLKR